MKERTRAKDVLDLVNAFFRENSIAWNKVGLVCTDGAPAMIGHRSGFVALIKQVAPHIVSNHCAIHKYALACKTLPLELKSVLDCVVKAVNFIRGRAVNSRLFKAFWDDHGKELQYLFHTEVRWLSRGKVLSRVAELVTEVAVFLREHGSVELATATLFDDNRFKLKIFYLADIFSLNELSYSLQGKNKSQIRRYREGLRLQKRKLSLWKKRVRNQNFAMFLLLNSEIGDQETNKWVTALIDDPISKEVKLVGFWGPHCTYFRFGDHHFSGQASPHHRPH